jgi:polysaccharide pyruvyl transferase WcaK-like protein
MSLKTVALFYGHVARNIGDLAINKGTLNLVRSVFPEARLRVVLLDVEQRIFDAETGAHLRPHQKIGSINVRPGTVRAR